MMSYPHVSKADFRDGMACLAGAVNIVTTDGPGGRAGLTASAVCSVTDSPPTLLVCINTGSSAAPAFLENDYFCVNTVGPAHEELAMTFGAGTPMAERFERAAWYRNVTGAPVLEGAVASFDCQVSHRHVVGTHEVIFGEIVGIRQQEDAPVTAWFARRFHALEV
ncbi:flavin reductase [Pseudooceanicola antarcticus]|uniref:FMN reductase n=2 Tax=Pseudooceanicola antarcticus TaxID=1247613 RepID=A0A285J130_9RHOB|nr:FMN reductase [Pseudooceanicola antarcticus]SNY53918.1 flavin reductase [Pseudooceanicola antarcticus]